MRPFKLFLPLMIMSAFVACTKVNKDPDGINGNQSADSMATFRVKSLEGEGRFASITGKKDGSKDSLWASNWKVPTSVDFTLTACIEDRTTRKDAMEHQFHVEDPATGNRIPDIRPTTVGGCFSWIEPINFSYFVRKSHWGVIERDIIGDGVHTGRQRVRIALNPWAVGGGARDDGDSVRFLRDKPLPPALLSPVIGPAAFGSTFDRLDNSGLQPDKLFVDDVNIQTIRRGERNKGMFFRMNITMQPKVVFANHAGVEPPGMRALSSGDFLVIAHLVLNNAGPKLDERVILTSMTDEKALPGESIPGVIGSGRVIDGKLIARVDAWVDARYPQGNLELVLKLIPKGVRGLDSFEGVYELGSMRNLSSNFSGALNEGCRDKFPEQSCAIAPYLKAATNFEALRDKGYAKANSPYLFERLKLRFVQVQPGETTTQRTVAYTASTCVIDVFTGERPIGLPFTIRYKIPTRDENAKRGLSVPTEEDGCLNWSSIIDHKYYFPEEFIEQVITITKDTGVSRDLRFYLNPWDDKFTFGFDEREFQKEYWENQKLRRKIPSRFFLDDYGYRTVRFQYNIDSLMSLEVKKTVLMYLSPRVLRYSGIINARKMTEPLRDGIWLMKVGIQKNYLDPASVGVSIDALRDRVDSVQKKEEIPPNQSVMMVAHETPGQRDRFSKNRLRKLGIEAPSKEFISTNTALVRATDGVVIQPVELSMRDLRLMRIRSNFLVQLETVDERKLQAHNVLHKGFTEEMDQLIKDRAKSNALLGKEEIIPENEEEEKARHETEDQRIRQKVEDRISLVRQLFNEITKSLDALGPDEIRLDNFNLNPEQQRFVKPLFEKLNLELQANDFTNITLPSCRDINCNTFLEPESGLVKRTFVGPVIFLSNAYSDSVRATDSLDEARCNIAIDTEDPDERLLLQWADDLFKSTNTRYKETRKNTIYEFSEYFGSLRHLCYKNVDDLIAKEQEDRYIYEQNIPVLSSVYNFSSAFALNFLSLSDEKPKKVGMDSTTLQRCNGDLVSCMAETDEHRVPLVQGLQWVNENLSLVHSRISSFAEWAGLYERKIKPTAWSAEDIRVALFEHVDPSVRRFAACTLLSENFVQTLKGNGGRLHKPAEQIRQELIGICLKNNREPIFFDQKLRVFKTGSEGDSYVFLGGYQMNINVGQSFSVSRSESYSWGWGVEGADFVGPLGGLASAGIGQLGSGVVKPLSLKVGGGQSMSGSDGTSISESTYLVSQIAGFRVRLDEYERCVALTFTSDFYQVMRLKSVISYDPRYYGPMRSLFVCEGRRITEPKYVDETYFYFTQHFTEGDMLDQADLYNHPWLLALRGYRDFGSFISLVRAQEVVSFWNFADGVFSPKERPIDWPLAHMKAAYKQIVPSYPGFYTVLTPDERGTEFPLESRAKTIDDDINFEVISRDQRGDGINLNRRAN